MFHPNVIIYNYELFILLQAKSAGDFQGVELMHSALHKVGGGVLPLNALLHMCSLTCCSLKTLLPPDHQSSAGGDIAKRPALLVHSGDGDGADHSDGQSTVPVAAEVTGQLVLSTSRVMDYYTKQARAPGWLQNTLQQANMCLVSG